MPLVPRLKVAVEDRRDVAQEGASLFGDQNTITGPPHQAVALERRKAFQFGFEECGVDAPLDGAVILMRTGLQITRSRDAQAAS